MAKRIENASRHTEYKGSSEGGQQTLTSFYEWMAEQEHKWMVKG